MSAPIVCALLAMQCLTTAVSAPVRGLNAVQISRQEAYAIVRRSLTPVKSAVMAASYGDGYNYICWYESKFQWYRVDFYRYRHLYARAIAYHDKLKVWDIQNGKFGLDPIQTRELHHEVNIWKEISSDVQIGNKDGFNFDLSLPACSENPIDSALHLLEPNKKNSVNSETYYVQNFSILRPNNVCISWAARENDNQWFPGVQIVSSIDINVKNRSIDRVLLHVTTPDKKGEVNLVEKLVYLEKNISISEHVFAHPQTQDE